jgi:hypothetical protein
VENAMSVTREREKRSPRGVKVAWGCGESIGLHCVDGRGKPGVHAKLYNNGDSVGFVIGDVAGYIHVLSNGELGIVVYQEDELR